MNDHKRESIGFCSWHHSLKLLVYIVDYNIWKENKNVQLALKSISWWLFCYGVGAKTSSLRLRSAAVTGALVSDSPVIRSPTCLTFRHFIFHLVNACSTYILLTVYSISKMLMLISYVSWPTAALKRSSSIRINPHMLVLISYVGYFICRHDLHCDNDKLHTLTPTVFGTVV